MRMCSLVVCKLQLFGKYAQAVHLCQKKIKYTLQYVKGNAGGIPELEMKR